MLVLALCGCAAQPAPPPQVVERIIERPAAPIIVEKIVVKETPPRIVEKVVVKEAPPRVIEKVIIKEVPSTPEVPARSVATPPIIVGPSRPLPGPSPKPKEQQKKQVKAPVCHGLSHVECGKRPECGWTLGHERKGGIVQPYCHLKPKR